MKIVQAFEESKILLKGINKNNWKWNKRTKRRIFRNIIRYLLENMLTEKEILRAGWGNKEQKGILRATYVCKMNFCFHPIL